VDGTLRKLETAKHLRECKAIARLRDKFENSKTPFQRGDCGSFLDSQKDTCFQLIGF
jgi:hypothetical protein